MKKFFFWLIQWTWGFPQTLIGCIHRLCTLNSVVDYHSLKCTTVYFAKSKRISGAVSIGPFITCYNYLDAMVCAHEYGHSIQSLILGPLWLFIIGIPSLVWAGCFGKYRQKHNISYYSFYTEKWANKLARVDFD